MNILVVDDESVIRNGIERTIRNHFPQHQVFIAAGPAEAVELLQRAAIDLVLTDVLMPGMTGLELISLTRGRLAHIKWIVISAYSEFAYAQEAVRLGAKDYLLKPIGKDSLIEKLKEMDEEIAAENKRSKEVKLLAQNLRFLREAVTARWASNLDLGGIDISPIIGDHPYFHLIMLRMDGDADLRLEHFIIDNVLSELIDSAGKGFVASINSKNLLGLVTLREGEELSKLIEQLRTHLKRYLKIPFQVLHSGHINNISCVPEQIRLMRKMSESKVYDHYASGGEKAVEVALQYIHTNFAAELTLEKVASFVFLNPVYFSQLFKQKTGHGFKDYVTQQRLDRAMTLLRESELKISEIAERVGYPDVRHFSQIFRKKTGLTPSECRLGGLTSL